MSRPGIHCVETQSLVYLGFYVAFNTVQVISRRVVGRAEETSTYSSSGFCTVNCRPTASNYQLSHLRPCREPNPGLRGGRQECYQHFKCDHVTKMKSPRAAYTEVFWNSLVKFTTRRCSLFEVKSGAVFIVLFKILLHLQVMLTPGSRTRR